MDTATEKSAPLSDGPVVAAFPPRKQTHSMQS